MANILTKIKTPTMFLLVLIISLATLDFIMPALITKIFENDMVRFIILMSIIFIGKTNFEYAILLGAFYLLITEKVMAQQIKDAVSKLTSDVEETEETDE